MIRLRTTTLVLTLFVLTGAMIVGLTSYSYHPAPLKEQHESAHRVP
jgi:hypothetical protein